MIRTETESQKWRSYGGLSAGKGKEENRGKGTGVKKHIGRYKIDGGCKV